MPPRTALSVIWFAREPTNPEARPQLREQPHHGDLHTALARAVDESNTPGFMLGQVLAADGHVLATVAPAGACKLTTPT
jgi:hypothetical protein